MINFDSCLFNRQLSGLIYDEIAHSTDHCISFARFMELALFAPSLGYYQTNKNLLGKRGDFITAPEISPWFSYCIANYCHPILQSLSSHTSAIMEIGPGTGRMAADVLLSLERLDCLPSRYLLIEVSDYLRQQQQINLEQWVPHLVNRIEYHASLPIEPIEGIILANEVIDVLPVHRFGIEKGALYEYCVGESNGQFVWRKAALGTTLMQERLKQIQSDYLEGVDNYVSEIRLSLEDWLLSVQACLSRGCIILIDYGKPAREYYHPIRRTGTLRCYYQHSSNNEPLERIGFQDITSEVDFTQVANLAVRAGLELTAFVPQAAFLLASGLLKALELNYSDAMYLETKGKLYQLVSPLEMGESCKVMVLGRGLGCHLLSLEAYDRRFIL